jgi:hypothetical protein
MNNRMDDRALKQVIPFHGSDVEMVQFERPGDSGEMSRIGRFLCLIGVGMPNPEKPNVWNWNPAVITLLLVMASGIYYFAHQNGVNETEIKQLHEKYNEAQVAIGAADKKAQDAKDLSLGGTPTPTPKEKLNAR